MEIIRVIFAVMSIMLSNVMVNAKLTIAFMDYQEDYAYTYNRSIAIIRQSLIDIRGERWFKEFIEDVFKSASKEEKPATNFFTFFGKGGELVVVGPKHCDDESLYRIKEVFDYLSNKEDTLYFSLGKFNKGSLPVDLSYVFSSHRHRNKLVVGNIRNDKFELYGGIPTYLLSEDLGSDYIKKCEEKGCMPLNCGSHWNEYVEITQKDIDFYFESLMERDKELISKKLPKKNNN